MELSRGRKNRIRRTVEIYKAVRRVLSRASPSSPARLVASVAVDFADLWAVGQNHTEWLRSIVKLRFPKDQDKLLDLLTEMEVNWLSEAANHVRSLEKDLPALIRQIGRSPRRNSSRRRVGA